VEKTFYRRPLPAEAIAFSSPEGRALFADALAKGGLDGYFQLAEQPLGPLATLSAAHRLSLSAATDAP
jgi:hypothetical protein